MEESLAARSGAGKIPSSDKRLLEESLAARLKVSTSKVRSWKIPSSDKRVLEESFAARLESKYIKGQSWKIPLSAKRAVEESLAARLESKYIKGQEMEDIILCQERCGRVFSGKARKNVYQRSGAGR